VGGVRARNDVGGGVVGAIVARRRGEVTLWISALCLNAPLTSNFASTEMLSAVYVLCLLLWLNALSPWFPLWYPRRAVCAALALRVVVDVQIPKYKLR